MMTVSADNLPEIHLTDTLTGRKQPLRTLEPGAVGIYCCGPTVYDMSHIGHARAALAPDVMVRFLREVGYRVRYVRNITDIDDKIIARAQQDGTPAREIATRYTAEYHRDLDALHMLPPDVEPRVSDHLPQIIAMIEDLLARDLAYAVDGDVYYRVGRFAAYGRLSGRSREEMLEGAGSRIEVDARKETPLDFALWKAAKPDEPAWDSPWGQGRPGWHIECSAMSSTHLGATFDIHTGGRDLIFPHHENEIAQSRGAHGDDSFARYWVHNGFINFAGEKMSKSLGNFWTIREILGLYQPEVLRYFLMTVHYRSGLNFEVEVPCPACGALLSQAEQERVTCAACGHQSDTATLRRQVRFPGLEEADDRVASVYTTLQGVQQQLAGAGPAAPEGEVLPGVAALWEEFSGAMCNDFNTPAALGVLSRPLHEVNALLASGKGVARDVRRRTLARFAGQMQRVAGVLGLFAADPDHYLTGRRDRKAARLGLDVARVEELVARRSAARSDRDWSAADRLRDELAAMGVSVQDGPTGSVWTL